MGKTWEKHGKILENMFTIFFPAMFDITWKGIYKRISEYCNKNEDLTG